MVRRCRASFCRLPDERSALVDVAHFSVVAISDFDLGEPARETKGHVEFGSDHDSAGSVDESLLIVLISEDGVALGKLGNPSVLRLDDVLALGVDESPLAFPI